MSPHGLAVARGRLEKRLDRLLEWNLTHPGNRTFQRHLAGHRDEILTFLYDPVLAHAVDVELQPIAVGLRGDHPPELQRLRRSAYGQRRLEIRLFGIMSLQDR